MASPTSPTGDTLITIKLSIDGCLKKLKLPLKDMDPDVLPGKLRHLLAITQENSVIFERFSDSAGGYITLDPNNPQVYKTLVRAAKAKLKLRLKATVTPVQEQEQTEESIETEAKNLAIPLAPLIVRTPAFPPAQRESTALDRRSNGSGIFEFREARASQQTLVNLSEPAAPEFFKSAPVTSSKELPAPVQEDIPIRGRRPAMPSQAWSVYCNECDVAMNDAHYHCNICDAGDYDLCEKCVSDGKLCPGEGHWLIKRSIKDGKVIASTTERLSPRKSKAVETEVVKPIPGAFTPETKTLVDESPLPTRTCNSCVEVRPDHEFVTCLSCEDFDLCLDCHKGNTHGHHPAHAFKPSTSETVLSYDAKDLLAAGRNVRHNANCDGCDKKVYGVRHKCLNCPDWDFCNECVKDARHTHPRHRFAALYEPIEDGHVNLTRHYGIFCDGPLCRASAQQKYISGTRYKCAVCHDTDFCEACEALPTNEHNRTHPLIKFKTPVRGVSITTENEDANGGIRKLGDRVASGLYKTKTASTETTPVQQASAATQVQTMAEIKPTATASTSAPAVQAEESKPSELRTLNAAFVKDSITDGTKITAGALFTQVWTMKNPGPNPWPAGCSVRYVGGDLMLVLPQKRVASAIELNKAKETSVISRDVQIGEEVAFSIMLKAPARVGKCISYWRLMSADGTPFGHRLWTDIEVTAQPSVYGMNAPPTVTSVNNPRVVGGQPPYSFPHFPQDPATQQAFANQQLYMQQQQQQRLAMRQQMLAQQVAANRPIGLDHQATSFNQPPPFDQSSAFNKQTSGAPLPFSSIMGPSRWIPGPAALPPGPPPAQPSSSAELDSFAKEEDRARKEAAKQRVDTIKAKLLRSREERAQNALAAGFDTYPAGLDRARRDALRGLSSRPTEFDMARREAVANMNKANLEALKEKMHAKLNANKNMKDAVMEKPTEKDAEKETEKQEQKQEEKDSQSSSMIFPTLEKESPSSSVYFSGSSSKGKAAYVENEDGEVERSATPTAPATVAPSDLASPRSEIDFEDLTDDLEVLSADGEESEDDGFLTDEEYDILDASDQETVASK